MSGPSRDIIKHIFTLFVQSFKPKRMKSEFRGEDYFGNKYYEVPADPQAGKRRPERWFQPVQKENYGQELPGEWESWLRGRRKEPPTEEELLKNLAISDMKKRNALKVEAKADADRGYKIEHQDAKGMSSFPQYDEFEVMPGKKKNSPD